MKKIYLLVILGATFSACHHVYYAPNSANAPQLSQKGEVRVNALYTSGTDSEFSGGELQVAYATGSNSAVMLNGFSAGESETFNSYGTGMHTEKGNGAYLEGAYGYFKALGDKKKWIIDAYAGAGLGFVKNDYGSNHRSRVGITKFFLQPSIGYKSKNFEFAWVPKLSLINWRVTDRQGSSTEMQEMQDAMTFIESKPSFFSFEPAFLLRAGAKDLKIQTGVSFSNFKTGNAYYYSNLIESANGHIGISINIAPTKK